MQNKLRITLYLKDDGSKWVLSNNNLLSNIEKEKIIKILDENIDPRIPQIPTFPLRVGQILLANIGNNIQTKVQIHDVSWQHEIYNEDKWDYYFECYRMDHGHPVCLRITDFILNNNEISE